MIEIEDEGDDQFLSLVEAAEAEAIASARVIKRPKLPVVDSGNETGQEDDQEQEGSYTAALRGSRSALWKLQQKQLGNLHDKGGGNIAVPSSTMAAGACFKCGMTGHWARDCGGQGSSVDRADRLPAAKPCPCGSGTCLVLTSNTAKNPGRMFYRCPLKAENGGCNFFEWCDTPSSECDSGTVMDGQSNARVPVLHCPCGAGSCLVLVSKGGKNEGQRYYIAPAAFGQPLAYNLPALSLSKMSNLASEPEFEQAYNELVSTLESSKLFQVSPDLKKCLPVVSIPERIIQFRVVWEDDKGVLQVNRGYRVQFNSALGPYKGGLRFHPTVNLSILKFLGFEQIFKNALTGLNMGGGKGGSDFDPKGKSDNEIRRFCYAFVRELSRHIGQFTDIPAGDIGVGGREVGYMFGAYKAYRNSWEGVITGKGGSWGGSLIRPEATGYGLVYYVNHMISYASGGKESFAGKRVAISGSGNVAQFAALKVLELGGKVISLSDSKGALIAVGDETFTESDVELIAKVKLERGYLNQLYEAEDSTLKARFKYLPGERPWKHLEKVDVVLPSATQNEVEADEAKALIAAGARYLAEGSNMGSTQGAIDVYEEDRKTRKTEGLWYGPAKAANCGGVAVSGLEMAQNSQRVNWTSEHVDKELAGIMERCFWNCLNTAKEYYDVAEGELPSLVAGANIAGYIKVARAMHDHGEWW